MKYLFCAAVVSFAFASPANANLVDVALDGSNGGTFAGLGSSIATYTVDVLIEDAANGGFDNYELVITMTATNGPVNRTNAMTGVGVGSNVAMGGGVADVESVDGDETLAFTFMLNPDEPLDSVEIDEFQLEDFDHGAVTSGGAGTAEYGVLATAGGAEEDLAGTTTDISTFTGTSFTVDPFTGPDQNFAVGQVAGITTLSFNATSVPEPSSVLLCGLCFGGLVLRRRRSSTVA